MNKFLYYLRCELNKYFNIIYSFLYISKFFKIILVFIFSCYKYIFRISVTQSCFFSIFMLKEDLVNICCHTLFCIQKFIPNKYT